MESQPAVGALLRDWRLRRRRSQLDLALDARVSPRHLSFVESGRARPSRGLLLSLGDVLDLPLRERNRLLLAAGFAPHFPEHRLASPVLAGARDAVERLLDAHAPFPALAVDRHWNLQLANRPAQRLLSGVAEHLRSPVANMLRISLHPEGLAPLIDNLGEWRRHLLARLRKLVAATADPGLAQLLAELSSWPALPGETQPVRDESPLPEVMVLFRLRTPLGELALFSTVTTFGTPLDLTLSELMLESFYPADAATAERLRQLDAQA